MVYITCVVHVLNCIAVKVRDIFPNVNKLEGEHGLQLFYFIWFILIILKNLFLL